MQRTENPQNVVQFHESPQNMRLWASGQNQRSAKPSSAGSNPARRSKKFYRTLQVWHGFCIIRFGLVAELVVCTCLLSSDDEGSNPSGTTNNSEYDW